MQYDDILHVASSVIYGIHFILLIYLLFGRVWYIFRDTEYRLSLKTVYCFVTFCVFQLCSAGSFMFIVWMTNQHDSSIFIAYLFGSISMLIITIWITLLYIYKLFQVISHNADSKNDVLLQSITKYTVLAIVWISTAICFWIIPLMEDNLLNSSWYFVIYHGFMLLDVATNDIAFFLGFSFTDKLYMRLCSCLHGLIEKIFVFLVQYAQKRRTKRFKSVYQRKMEERKREYDAKKAEENKRKLSQSVAKIINSSSSKGKEEQRQQRVQTLDEKNVIQNIKEETNVKIVVTEANENESDKTVSHCKEMNDAAQTPESPLLQNDYVGQYKLPQTQQLHAQMVTIQSK